MNIQDISIRKRLLLSNFIMICIPVVVLLLLSAATFLVLQFGTINRASIISFIWPESGPTVSTQFELSRLRVRADSFRGDHLGPLLQASRHLETLGYRVVLYHQDTMLYHTAGSEGADTWHEALTKSPGGEAAIAWSDQGLAFHYTSPASGVRAAVVGSRPLRPQGEFIDVSSKDVLKGAFLFVVAFLLLLIIVIGLVLSRWLALQIIQPLETLRNTAEAISNGNLDTAVTTLGNDEIGQTCRSFEQMRQQLQAAQAVRERYDQNRKELIAGISHDLSTPLTKIEGYAYGLRDGIANTPEKRQHYIGMIIDTAQSMGKLVRTLFLFSKLDLHQVPFQWEVVDICAYVTDYVTEQRDLLAKRGLQVTVCQQLPQALVSIDRSQFQRVIENIIENSIKYKDSDVGTLVITLQQTQPGRVELLFADSGQGIADDRDLPKLFDSFYRTDKARSQVAKGSGLGLAVVKQIITTMGGTIWAARTEPKGLTIGIALPEGERHETSTHN